jgi:uncharacterized protein YdeI (YjbR/CyaY-like superfamily)
MAERGMSDEPTFFASVKDWRDWLAANHASSDGLEVGLIKKGAGIPGIMLEEAVDEALCWGWIDSRAHSIDKQRWVIRMTPRRQKSPWSAISIKRVERLIAEGRMTPAGRAAFYKRRQAPDPP